jgi:putative phosphoesterase
LKIGLLSDIHSDIDALDRVLEEMRAHGVEAIYCAGDIVGYGPSPNETVARLVENGILAVRGNHDRWAIDRGAAMIDPHNVGALSDATLDYLRALPPLRMFDLDHKLVVVTHGIPGDDLEYLTRERFRSCDLREMLGDLAVDLLIVGHTHEPMWYRCWRGSIVNPGAIYSPPSHFRSSRTFAILDAQEETVAFYDVESGAYVPVEPWDDGDE